MKWKAGHLSVLLSLCSASLIYCAIPCSVVTAQVLPGGSSSNIKAQESAQHAAQMSTIGEIQAALDNYNQAIQLDPNYIDAYYFRSNLLAAIGQLDYSFADLQKIAEIYRSRGQIEQATDIEEYVKELQQSLNNGDLEIQEMQ